MIVCCGCQVMTITFIQKVVVLSLCIRLLLQDDLLERALMQGGGSSSNLSRLNLYESLRTAGATSLLENLQSQLKQREGEVQQLQVGAAKVGQGSSKGCHRVSLAHSLVG